MTNDRLTPEWTDEIKDAFGGRGEKGARGELIAIDILTNLGFDVSYHPKDKGLQTSGIDLFINKLPVDVKNNLKTGGDVGVEQKKLFRTKSVFWMHINENNPDDFIIYKVNEMAEWVATHVPPWVKMAWVPRDVVASFR